MLWLYTLALLWLLRATPRARRPARVAAGMVVLCGITMAAQVWATWRDAPPDGLAYVCSIRHPSAVGEATQLLLYLPGARDGKIQLPLLHATQWIHPPTEAIAIRWTPWAIQLTADLRRPNAGVWLSGFTVNSDLVRRPQGLDGARGVWWLEPGRPPLRMTPSGNGAELGSGLGTSDPGDVFLEGLSAGEKTWIASLLPIPDSAVAHGMLRLGPRAPWHWNAGGVPLEIRPLLDLRWTPANKR